MGFERFGIMSFTSQTRAAPFVDLLDKGIVAGTKCKSCGSFSFPPRTDCAHCLSGSVEWVEVKGTGNLISYSKLAYAPTGFEADLPYTIALVEFPGNIKVFGRLNKDMKDDEISIGMSLMWHVVRLSNERIIYEFNKI